jgi:hypothetical protein
VTHATRWLEPWFSAYALAGLLVNGIVPLLIPLTTEKRGPTITGLVVASFFVGQLSAPMIGAMADRTGRQRQVFLGSFPLMALGAVGFGLADGPAPWMLSAVLAGAAAGAAQTIGSVFIVEGHPRSEWDMRIGWFRLTFGRQRLVSRATPATPPQAPESHATSRFHRFHRAGGGVAGPVRPVPGDLAAGDDRRADDPQRDASGDA